MWVAGRHVARAVLGDMGAGISPYPYVLIYPQDEHERLLIAALDRLGVSVERETELVNFDEASTCVVAHLKRADGSTSSCEATFLAGCDGAHSSVREKLAVGFQGGTYEHLFYVADVDASGTAVNGEVHVGLDASDFLAVFPLKEDHARLVGTIRETADERCETLSWEDVSTRVVGWMNIRVARVNWFSTYRVHHRVATQFHRGRVFLLGDAAHIHSPVGGQGMNTGIGDAVNLAWKLAAVLGRAADPAILETYETERIAFARRLVATTDQVFTAVTSSTPLAQAMRLHIVPRLLPSLFAFRSVRRLAFRTVSQTAIEYRGSPLSEGHAGRVHGGDRLPWVTIDSRAPRDNFAPLSSLSWQLHVYGDSSPKIRAVCAARRLQLEVFDWTHAMQQVGLRRSALYLVRPDGYLALVTGVQDPRSLTSYLDARRIDASSSGNTQDLN
jgi:2-polyprenyl-6-methoxyphenol hydroxylase-like FAD-dependent oxidoreductase